MSVIGKTVKSKATGLQGVITGVSGNKLSVSFDGHASITAPLFVYDIDSELQKEIDEETIAQNKNGATTYKTRNKEQPLASYRRIEYLNAEDKVEFYRINELLNSCFGTEYQAWMKGTWSLNNNYWCWFPRLVKTLKDEPATNGCTNVISEDWNTLIYDEHKNTVRDTSNDPNDAFAIIFAREPDDGPLLFRGVYVYEHQQSSFKHYVYRRVATKIRIIGNPAYDIEMLDKVE